MDLHDLTSFMYRPLEYPLVLLPAVFLIGAIIGSWLNVCILRIPLEKSVIWPDSHCASCLTRIAWYDNLPIVSYWRLGGRCRRCGAEFSARYFWIELGVAILFAVTFWWDLTFGDRVRTNLVPGQTYLPIPKAHLLVLWLFHISFLCFLLVASFTDLDHREIPLRVTIPGTAVGVGFSLWVGYPWPLTTPIPDIPQFGGAEVPEFFALPNAAQFWPYWAPPLDWTPYGSLAIGLVTSVVGLLVGTGLVRVIRSVFSWGFGKEAMGLGDADLLMLIGAYLGWQATILTFVWGVLLLGFYALIFGFIFRVSRELPFGPALALGAVLTVWAPLPLPLLTQRYFFDGLLVLGLTVLAGAFSLLLALVIRSFRLVRQAG